jgi:hypothetical protein
MATFLFTYTGGMSPSTPEEGQKVMAAWTAWFQGIGAGVVDMGNPTGPTRTVSPDGAVADSDGPTGYSIIRADSLDAAVAIAQGCPVRHGGGSVLVSEIQPLM